MARRTGADDRGYFPKGESVLRAVMEERVVGTLYGARALVVGALEPMAFTGTYLRSRATRTGDYYGRLLDTQAVFEEVFFGTRAEADAALEPVRRMHARVKGTVDEGVGPDYPAGSTYDSGDPWLSLWTMGVLCESAYAVHRSYVRDLTEQLSFPLVQQAVRAGGIVIPAPLRHGPVGKRSRQVLGPLRARGADLIRALQQRLPLPA